MTLAYGSAVLVLFNLKLVTSVKLNGNDRRKDAVKCCNGPPAKLISPSDYSTTI